MKRILIMVAVVMVSIVAVSQDTNFKLTSLKFAATWTGITVGSDSGGLYNYPYKEIYTFSNANPGKLRMSVYIAGSDYAQSIFPLTPKESAKLAAASSQLRFAQNTQDIPLTLGRPNKSPETINQPYLKTLKSGEQAMVVDAVQNKIITNKQSGMLRSSSSITVTLPEYETPYPVEICDETWLNIYKGWLVDNNAFPIWQDDIKSFAAGDHTVTFEWDGHSNRDKKGNFGTDDAIIRLIEDQGALFVLEDVTDINNPVILDIEGSATWPFNSYSYRTLGTNAISEDWVGTRDMPIIANFIIKDPFCDFAPNDALRGGPQAMMDFLNSECFIGNGVLAYATTGNSSIDGVAAATQKTFDGTIKANEVSSLTWQPVPGPNHPELTTKLTNDGATYYILTIIWHSLDPNDYTVGKGTPLLGFYIHTIQAQDFPQYILLGSPASMENPAVDKVTVIWKDDAPYFAVNGQEIKADIYDLTGKKVQFVERSKFYIVQTRTADGKKYAQIVIR